MKEEQNSNVSAQELEREGVIDKLKKFKLRIKFNDTDNEAWKKCTITMQDCVLNGKADIKIKLKHRDDPSKVPHDFKVPHTATSIVAREGYYKIEYNYDFDQIIHYLKLIIFYDALQNPLKDILFSYDIKHFHQADKLSDKHEPDGQKPHSSGAGGGRGEL